MINESMIVGSIASPNRLNEISTQFNTQKTNGTNFTTWVSNEMMTINSQINKAEFNVRELAAGRADNLHHVMVSLSRAKLSFELAVEVRNKVLEGYQEIIKMQI